MKKAFPLTNIIRHTLIVFFMLTILLPLAWVLLLSIKSMPDSMRGNLWPRKFDFNHYAYVFEKIDTLTEPIQQHLHYLSNRSVDFYLRCTRRLCDCSSASQGQPFLGDSSGTLTLFSNSSGLHHFSL